MKTKKYTSSLRQEAFVLSSLCAKICEAAITPTSPYGKLADVVREAIFEWGVVHVVRERKGGLRLKRADEVASPFGEGYEQEIYFKDLEENREGRYRTCVSLPPLQEEILTTAIEDYPPQYKTRSDVINFAIIQWGLTHLQLTFADGGWIFSEPLTLRDAFDFDPTATSLKVAALYPESITASGNLFAEASKNQAFSKGSVALPFYRPDADMSYLEDVRAGREMKVREESREETSTNAQATGSTSTDAPEEKLDRLMELLDSMD